MGQAIEPMKGIRGVLLSHLCDPVRQASALLQVQSRQATNGRNANVRDVRARVLQAAERDRTRRGSLLFVCLQVPSGSRQAEPSTRRIQVRPTRCWISLEMGRVRLSGQRARACVGTSLGDGTASRTAAINQRDDSSSERRQVGQPHRELAGTHECGTRPVAHERAEAFRNLTVRFDNWRQRQAIVPAVCAA